MHYLNAFLFLFFSKLLHHLPCFLQAKAFYSYWTEPATVKNLKRGLASLFQVQLKTGKVIEVNWAITLHNTAFSHIFSMYFMGTIIIFDVFGQNDVSGRCTVEYKAIKGQVTRTKILETCQTAEEGFTTHSQVCRHPHRLSACKRKYLLDH